jgi:hypothetical protein
MVRKKNLVIVVLLTFCLTAMLFYAMPALGVVRVYNPVYDVGHYGRIDGRDIAAVASAFGTTGDPTVPVAPTYSLQMVTLTMSATGQSYSGSYPMFTGNGYSRMALWIIPVSATPATGSWSITLYLNYITWEGATETLSTSTLSVTFTITSGSIGSYTAPPPFITQTKAPDCNVMWTTLTSSGPPGWSITFDVYAYFRYE